VHNSAANERQRPWALLVSKFFENYEAEIGKKNVAAQALWCSQVLNLTPTFKWDTHGESHSTARQLSVESFDDMCECWSWFDCVMRLGETDLRYVLIIALPPQNLPTCVWMISTVSVLFERRKMSLKVSKKSENFWELACATSFRYRSCNFQKGRLERSNI